MQKYWFWIVKNFTAHMWVHKQIQHRWDVGEKIHNLSIMVQKHFLYHIKLHIIAKLADCFSNKGMLANMPQTLKCAPDVRYTEV